MGFHGRNGMGYATVVINEIALFQFIFCVALFEDAFAFDYVDKLISKVFIGIDKLTLFGLTDGDGYIVIYETPWRKNFQFQIMSFCDLTILSLSDNNLIYHHAPEKRKWGDLTNSLFQIEGLLKDST